MDEKDRKIIEMLSEDARTPFTEIAKTLGVSEATVRKRVDSLEREGVIRKFTIEVDPRKLGFGSVALVGLDVEPEHFLEAAERIAGIPQVRWVATSTGDHMIMAEIWARDARELLDIVSGQIERMEGVRRVCPAIILERVT
jgi:Lrp/AsnC family transcriptional regulator for asnA, asnC and gidA